MVLLNSGQNDYYLLFVLLVDELSTGFHNYEIDACNKLCLCHKLSVQ